MSTATELLDLTAAQAIERVKRGELDPADLWRLYRERTLADDLHAFTWVSEETEPPPLPDGATLGGVLGPDGRALLERMG